LAAIASLPTIEKYGQAENGSSDHGSGRGEDPMAEYAFLSRRSGFLGHCLQFLNQNVGVEFAGDLGPETFVEASTKRKRGKRDGSIYNILI
jgi:hypothetical protein